MARGAALSGPSNCRITEPRGVLVLQGRDGLTCREHVENCAPCRAIITDTTVDPTLAANVGSEWRLHSEMRAVRANDAMAWSQIGLTKCLCATTAIQAGTRTVCALRAYQMVIGFARIALAWDARAEWFLESTVISLVSEAC